MRRTPLLLTLLVAGCHRGAPHAEPSEEPAPMSPIPVPEDAGRVHGHPTRTLTFRMPDVTFSIDDVHLSTRLEDVRRRRSAAVVVNGGFFDTRGEPIGLAISRGETLSRFSPTLSGGVFWIRDSRAHVSATEGYAETNVDFAVQCRPRLVVASRSNIRSDDGRRAARTALCLRDAGREVELVVALPSEEDAGPTLSELAADLVAAGCEDALNLDGGPSTGWADAADAGPFFHAPAAPVRHAIVVQRR